jgi:hypothetical protein
MAKRKRPSRAKAASTSSPLLRRAGRRLHLRNSGLEVWLYDDASREHICAGNAATELPTGMPARFDELTREGLIVGYSLEQDDDLDVEVHIGEPLTERELAKGRWLAPQTAFLRLPSGRLCVESNDASRVGSGQPTEQGGAVEVPPGDYRLALYRADHEALSREHLTWHGPQEVIVLTPGGNRGDAAVDLLPFEHKRDMSWVGKYQVRGKRAEALAWFPDYWDTFVLNLDAAAAQQLSLAPGMYLRTEVRALAITLISVYAASWADARRLPPPAGVPLHEYGLAALSPMGEWNGAQALYCRRERTKTRIEDEHHNIWVPAVVEVLDARPLPRAAGRSLAPSDLAEKEYFDPGFLALIWSDLLPEAGDADEFPLAKALKALGRHLKKLGLAPLGDWEWSELINGQPVESCGRLYAGPGHTVALVFAQNGICELLFINGFGDGRWTITGLADDFEHLVAQARTRGADNAGLAIQSMDEAVGTIAAAHRKAVAQVKAQPVAAPASAEEGAVFLERFLTGAFGPPAAG